MRPSLFRRQWPRPRRWVAAAAALVLTATGLTIGSPAQAVPLPIFDSFEGTPSSRWTVSTVAGMTSVTLGRIPGRTPHFGANMALLNSYPRVPASATIFQAITLDTVPTNGVRAWVNVCQILPTGVFLGPRVILRIRDGGTTGQIISNKGIPLQRNYQCTDKPESWGLLEFAPARPTTRTITVEIGAYPGTLLVDDFSMIAG